MKKEMAQKRYEDDPVLIILLLNLINQNLSNDEILRELNNSGYPMSPRTLQRVKNRIKKMTFPIPEDFLYKASGRVVANKIARIHIGFKKVMGILNNSKDENTQLKAIRTMLILEAGLDYTMTKSRTRLSKGFHF